jgi:hypothetical protein
MMDVHPYAWNSLRPAQEPRQQHREGPGLTRSRETTRAFLAQAEHAALVAE